MGGVEAEAAGTVSPFTRVLNFGKLLALKQEWTVREYRRKFKVLAAPSLIISDDVLESNFINGLKAPIQAEVRMLKPRKLGHIMNLARRLEDRNKLLKKALISYGPNKGKMGYTSPTTNNLQFTSYDHALGFHSTNIINLTTPRVAMVVRPCLMTRMAPTIKKLSNIEL